MVGAFNSATPSAASIDLLGFHTCFEFGAPGLLHALPALNDLRSESIMIKMHFSGLCNLYQPQIPRNLNHSCVQIKVIFNMSDLELEIGMRSNWKLVNSRV